MTFIGTHRSWRVAVNDENPTAAYDVEDWLEWSDPEPCDSNQSVRARAVIEVLRFDGGKRQRALAGGEIRLNGQNARCVRVGQAPGLTLGSATTCRSELAQALVPGLPRDFAPATLNGIVEVPAERPAGFSIVVDRAGYDEVDSSEIAFEFAGGLLLVTLLMRLRGSDLNTSTLEHVCSEGS